MHTSGRGSEKLAAALVEPVARALESNMADAFGTKMLERNDRPR
jgi:hypothetical protein